MKKTTHYTGHRWTNGELKTLMKLWADQTPLNEIGKELNQSPASISKQIQKLRKNGIPLERRKNGHISQVVNKSWTQGEVEYLLRRREEKATSLEIATELNRSHHAIQAMILKLRQEGVNIAMRGNGVRRLWDAESLKAVSIQFK
jgi:biotin operon repressor